MRPYRWRGTPGWNPATLPPATRGWRGPATREAVRIRDVPASCTCAWTYRIGPARFTRDKRDRDCPWHITAVAA